MAPLLSRALDPVLGVFTGVFAYYLYENNPRTAPPERDRLLELIKWKRSKSQQDTQDGTEEIDWKSLMNEAEKK